MFDYIVARSPSAPCVALSLSLPPPPPPPLLLVVPVLVAEIVAHFYPRLVELHNYSGKAVQVDIRLTLG